MHNINYDDYKPKINVSQFVELLLASLASNTKIHYIGKENIKTAQIPFDYKNRINMIMHQKNDWPIKFSKLIDLNEYCNNQIFWENILGSEIRIYLVKMEKQPIIDWQYDTLCVSYLEEEIENIKNKYDKEIVELMDYFTSLLNDYILSRQYIYNYEKQKRLFENNSENNKDSCRKISFFAKVLKKK